MAIAYADWLSGDRDLDGAAEAPASLYRAFDLHLSCALVLRRTATWRRGALISEPKAVANDRASALLDRASAIDEASNNQVPGLNDRMSDGNTR
jgi:hypothetical protein